MFSFKGYFLVLLVGLLVIATIVSLLPMLMKDIQWPILHKIKENQTEDFPCVNQNPQISATQGTRQVEQREELLLAVLVMSDPRINNTRRVIRQTWASDVPDGLVVRFVVGTAILSHSELKTVLDENSDHGDLIMLSRLDDRYNERSFKLLEMLVWANKNLNVRYLMKVDEGSFVQLKPLAKELLKMPIKRLYWGYFTGGSSVLKQGRWAEHAYSMCDRYTPYAHGGGYLLSADLVSYVAQNHALLKVYKNEDVTLGSWLSPLDIQREHDERFDTEYFSRGCNNSYLVTHKHSFNQLQVLHQTVKYTGKLCIEEFAKVGSYKYNWTAPPSQCCEL